MAEEPQTIIWTADAVSPLWKRRRVTGSARTVSPTAAGMAITMENRIAIPVFLFASCLSFFATAAAKDGIREEDRALAMANGT